MLFNETLDAISEVTNRKSTIIVESINEKYHDKHKNNRENLNILLKKGEETTGGRTTN